MTSIPTAAGSIDSADLGRTLVHEHVFVLGTEYQQNYQDDWDEDARVAEAVAALTKLNSLGIDTILDPTVLGLGRHIPRVRRIAEQVDLNIVVATGLYTFNDLPFQFHSNGPGLLFDMPEPLTELFVRDLTEGIAGTGVRAAFLKCAIDTPGLTPGVERVLRAVGQAHVRTGAPVMVHTDPHSRSGLVAQRVLAEEGVDLSKVLIAHCGDTTDAEYLAELADAGSHLGMDRFGLDDLLPFEKRVDTIVRLFERGYGDHVTISHDTSCYIDWFEPEALSRAAPRWHYRHICEDVLPALRERGLSDSDLDTILVANPCRLFA
ncbi:phosphotriesterase family protein [Streptomyces sp. NRRL S-813]|uniref:phosphotriesterase family protein n=1 Tax=Streptomyces sp. NRRL S-813 TaxID=1463919 RepID=UPI0004BE61B7|nr:phosphotriesterase [Streptomyces sp. NRRL S-813]